MSEQPTAPYSALWHLHRGDALDAYAHWPAPSAIISDGAYGIGGFQGDPRGVEALPDWYRPHIAAWSLRAVPSTTLWFWNTEVGWATTHPLLVEHGWEYVQAIIWDKGLAHIAGNVNGDTIRRFPVVTEVCGFYRRRLTFSSPSGPIPAKEWLRKEWCRSGLPLRAANEACGTTDAATRKYLGQDWQWYLPPPHMFERLVDHANQHGHPSGRPYFSLDGASSITADEWAKLSHPWHHEHGITNTWSAPPLHSDERVRAQGRESKRAMHPNQKPVALMRRIIAASTNEGDVVWEPFGGLCSAVVAAIEMGRQGFAAEHDPDFADLAESRIQAIAASQRLSAEDTQQIHRPAVSADPAELSVQPLPLGV